MCDSPINAINPTRVLQRRWDIAGKIVRGEVVADDMDAEIARAVVYRRHLDTQMSALSASVDLCPALEVAYGIFRENSVGRWALEANVLTGASDREVAERGGVCEKVVAAYVAIFFDVRRFLPAGAWVMEHLIGPARHSGFRENDVRSFWALSAVWLDRIYLHKFIGSYFTALQPDERPVMSVYFRPSVGLAVQSSVALQVLGTTRDGEMAEERLLRRLDYAETLDDNEAASALADRAAGNAIRLARDILAGKRRQKQKNTKPDRRVVREYRRHERKTNNVRSSSRLGTDVSLPILLQQG